MFHVKRTLGEASAGLSQSSYGDLPVLLRVSKAHLRNRKAPKGHASCMSPTGRLSKFLMRCRALRDSSSSWTTGVAYTAPVHLTRKPHRIWAPSECRHRRQTPASCALLPLTLGLGLRAHDWRAAVRTQRRKVHNNRYRGESWISGSAPVGTVRKDCSGRIDPPPTLWHHRQFEATKHLRTCARRSTSCPSTIRPSYQNQSRQLSAGMHSSHGGRSGTTRDALPA